MYQLPHPRNEQTANHFRWDGTVLHPIDVSMFWVGYFRAVWPYLFRVVFIRHAHHVPVTSSHLHSCAPETLSSLFLGMQIDRLLRCVNGSRRLYVIITGSKPDYVIMTAVNDKRTILIVSPALHHLVYSGSDKLRKIRHGGSGHDV